MKYGRTVSVWILISTVAPVLTFVWASSSSYIDLPPELITLTTVVLCPFYIWFLALDGDKSLWHGLEMLAIVMTANAIFYAIIGSLIWLAAHRLWPRIKVGFGRAQRNQ